MNTESNLSPLANDILVVVFFVLFGGLFLVVFLLLVVVWRVKNNKAKKFDVVFLSIMKFETESAIDIPFCYVLALKQYGDYDKAIREAEALHKKYLNDERYAFTYAELLIDHGDKQTAQKVLDFISSEYATKLNEENTQLLQNLKSKIVD